MDLNLITAELSFGGSVESLCERVIKALKVQYPIVTLSVDTRGTQIQCSHPSFALYLADWTREITEVVCVIISVVHCLESMPMYVRFVSGYLHLDLPRDNRRSYGDAYGNQRSGVLSGDIRGMLTRTSGPCRTSADVGQDQTGIARVYRQARVDDSREYQIAHWDSDGQAL